TSSRLQRAGAPLERGPSPLQSCRITTAGNGPGPSGRTISVGIRSDAPFGAVVAIVPPGAAAAQAARPPTSRTQPSARRAIEPTMVWILCHRGLAHTEAA